MLTKKQLKQLKPLIKHEKFGSILVEAIKGWKTTAPTKGTFGVLHPYKIGQAFKSYNKECCLLGAACLNKRPNKSFESIQQYIEDKFKISNSESRSLIQGFDQNFSGYTDEAFNFGKQVSDIVKE
jgi:hypothetical protein